MLHFLFVKNVVSDTFVLICSIYLTYHKILGKIICHHCGDHAKARRNCKKKNLYCNFSMYGPGVEKVYDELKQIFPDKNH